MRIRLAVLAALLTWTPAGYMVFGQGLGVSYYVSTTGSDSTGDGTSGNPWRNPQKCVGIVGPGDTCVIRTGTYTDTDTDGIVLYVSSARSANSGTASQPITFMAETLHTVKIQMSAATARNSYGIRVTVPYHRFIGIEITDDDIPSSQGSSFGSTGFSYGESGGATGTLLQRMHIHNIARNVCSDSPIGNSGIGGKPGSGSTVEFSKIHGIGRKRNGESGCSTTLFQNDHGIYVWAVTNYTVHHNLFYDNGRGYHIQNYAASQVTNGFYVYNNTFDQPTMAGSAPTACVILTYTNTDVQFKNNIFNNCPSGYAFTWFAPGVQTNVVMSFNVSDSADADMNNPGSKPSSGITTSNNTVGSGSINFTNAAAGDYSLLSTSVALNSGTTVGYAANGTPDKGAFEAPTFSSCQITAATKIQVSFNNALNFPLLPSSGVTTFTARKNTVANPVTSAVRVGDNVVELTVTNSFIGGDAGDISWASGNLTDSAFIGGVSTQKYVTALTDQSCLNNVGGGSYTRTVSAFRLEDYLGTEASPNILPLGRTSSDAENIANYPLYAGSKIRPRFVMVCSGADCPDEGYYLYYSRSGGADTVVPNSFGADGVAFCGDIQDTPANASATTCQTSVAGTCTPGGYVNSSNAIPTISGFLNGNKTELAYCVALSTGASGFFDFKLKTQAGAGITHTFTPRVTIGPPAGPGGM